MKSVKTEWERFKYSLGDSYFDDQTMNEIQNAFYAGSAKTAIGIIEDFKKQKPPNEFVTDLLALLDEISDYFNKRINEYEGRDENELTREPEKLYTPIDITTDMTDMEDMPDNPDFYIEVINDQDEIKCAKFYARHLYILEQGKPIILVYDDAVTLPDEYYKIEWSRVIQTNNTDEAVKKLKREIESGNFVLKKGDENE